MIGPPTTLSGTGVDRMGFLQANITRDNTEFVNGATIGDRCIFQMDQGLGIGSKNPFFNRHQLAMTKFINLNKQERYSQATTSCFGPSWPLCWLFRRFAKL
uniref:Uncharacterized protein n=1 Tax=Oryza punctata TaxID=4537 RepID=A0A0E0MBQ7_ORYPU